MHSSTNDALVLVMSYNTYTNEIGQTEQIRASNEIVYQARRVPMFIVTVLLDGSFIYAYVPYS